jgi:hypothetical protein
MAITLSDQSALIVIDVQRGLDDPSWGPRDNPECEANIGKLLAAWRAREWPVVFVRHDSRQPGSPLAPDQPGNAFKPIVTGQPDLLVVKSVNSAFYGEPSLESWLRTHGLKRILFSVHKPDEPTVGGGAWDYSLFVTAVNRRGGYITIPAGGEGTWTWSALAAVEPADDSSLLTRFACGFIDTQGADYSWSDCFPNGIEDHWTVEVGPLVERSRVEASVERWRHAARG